MTRSSTGDNSKSRQSRSTKTISQQIVRERGAGVKKAARRVARMSLIIASETRRGVEVVVAVKVAKVSRIGNVVGEKGEGRCDRSRYLAVLIISRFSLRASCSDTGVMPRLREAYKGIQALEQNLAELHRKMAADPAGGVRSLVRSGSLKDASTQSDGIAQAEQGDSETFSRALEVNKLTAERPSSSREQQMEDEGWIDLIGRHKRLADAHHDFMTVCLDPLIPASLHNLPVKYNIPTRLWQSGFHLLLERMRYTWIANVPTGGNAGAHHGFGRGPEGSHRDGLLSAKALDHLTDFIYDAYSFYTNLLEEQVLANFKTAWLEALGDLARYRMAIAAHVAAAERAERGGVARPHTIDHSNARIDDDETKRIDTAASIGAEVAENWNVEERETWRITARDWYVQGVTERPGEGRLHHHLGLLCRDVPGEELRALYHLSKR